MELAEVFGTLGTGYRSEMLTALRIAPNKRIRQRIVAQYGKQHPIPPTWVGHGAVAAFSKSDKFVMFIAKTAQHSEVCARLTDEIFLTAPLVRIQSYQINTFITRVTFKKLLLGHVPVQIR